MIIQYMPQTWFKVAVSATD